MSLFLAMKDKHGMPRVIPYLQYFAVRYGTMFFNMEAQVHVSGDSWMYPYQRTPMGNPYISPIYPYIVGVYELLSPRIPI